MTATEPFWPTTTEQFDAFDRVANAALAEVGLTEKYRLWIEVDGLVQCNPAWGDDSDERMLTRAVNLGWDAMKRRVEGER